MGQEQSGDSGIAWFKPKCNNSIEGAVTFWDGKCWVKLKGLKPNTTHAIHIHQFGDLSEGCMSTGGHYNPTNSTHGSYLDPSRPRHVGDLMNNITSDKKGKVEVVFGDPDLKVNELIGRAVVIHDLADDLGLQGVEKGDEFIAYHKLSIPQLCKLVKERNYKVNKKDRKKMIIKLNRESLRTGNAGGRMACAIIGRAK